MQHRFVPESSLDAFDTWYVDVTPVKGLIFTIGAIGRYDCTSQFTAFKRVLSKKYGSGREYESRFYYHDWIRRKDGQEFRRIELECIRIYNPERLSLKYTDLFIEASRIDELAAEAEAADL